MSDIAIRVENLSKQYRIGGPQARYKTLRESLTEAVGAPFRRLSSVVRGQSSAVSNETIWALKDVSFEVQRGEVVGIPSLRQAQYKRRAQGRHWAQWSGEEHAAEGSMPHHRPNGGPRRDSRAGGIAAGGGHWLPPRTDRAGEHLPERRYPFTSTGSACFRHRTDV
jgi:hypothetical protein